MDSVLRAFFDQFHTLLGLDSQAARDEAFIQFERTMVTRSMMAVLEQMSETQQQQYGVFLARTPEPTAEESAKWLQSTCGNATIEKIFQDTTAQYTQEYIKEMLKDAPEEIRKEIKVAFEALKKRG